MSEREPTRMVDDPELSVAIRDAIAAGREEAPSRAQLAALALKLGPLLGPGGGGGGGPIGGAEIAAGSAGAAVAKGGVSVAIKALGALAAAATITTGGVWYATRAPEDDHRTEQTTSAREPPAPNETSAPIPEGVDIPEDIDESVEEPPRAPTFERDPAAEMALIREAQSRLGADPAGALARAESHRRRFGDGGVLAQEREVVAIDALVRLDRRAEARRRADRFATRYPTSAHRRRIEVIVWD